MWHKYNATRTVINGISFGSKLEASVYSILLMREKAGEISNIRLQHSLIVKEKCPHCGDGPIKWKVDFSFIKGGKLAFAEAKGVKTASYLKRYRLFKAAPQGSLEIWTGSHRNPKLSELITP